MVMPTTREDDIFYFSLVGSSGTENAGCPVWPESFEVPIRTAKTQVEDLGNDRQSRDGTPFSHDSDAASVLGSTITANTSVSGSSQFGTDRSGGSGCPQIQGNSSNRGSRPSSRRPSPRARFRKRDSLDDYGQVVAAARNVPARETSNKAYRAASLMPESDEEQSDSDFDDEDEDPEWSGGQDEIEAAVLASTSDLAYAAQLIVKLHEEYNTDKGSKIDDWQMDVRRHGANDASQANGERLPERTTTCQQQGNPRKRRRASGGSTRRAFSDDEDADDGDGDEQYPYGFIGNGSGAPAVQLLACPFHKRDPLRYAISDSTRNHYRVCASGFKSIQRVKEHIERKHYPVQCERCFKKFPGPAKERARCLRELKAHRQQQESCTVGDPALKEGISDEQWANLKASSCKKKPQKCNVEKWFSIWEVLFPGEDRPEHPWHEQAASIATAGKQTLGDQQRFYKLFEDKLEWLLTTKKIGFTPGQEIEMKKTLLGSVRETCTLYNETWGLGASSSSSGQTCMQQTETQTPETTFTPFGEYQKGMEISGGLGAPTRAVTAPTTLTTSIPQSTMLTGLANPSMYPAQNPQTYGLGFQVPRFAPGLQGMSPNFTPSLGDMELDLDFSNSWPGGSLPFTNSESLAYVMSRNDLHEMSGQ